MQSGVGLIEVLIAVLILSFGMLGLAGLQLWSLKNNQSSLERGLAVIQTHSIVDAMRADRVNAIDHAFDIDIEETPVVGATFAQGYLVTWRADLIAALGPEAAGSVECDGALCTIRVRWNDRRGTGGSAQQEVVTQVQL